MLRGWKALDSRTIVLNAMKSQGVADAMALVTKSVADEIDGTGLIAEEHKIPKWRQRDFTNVSVGIPYRYKEQVYKLWQQHDATNQPDWNPEDAVSLWDIVHTKDPSYAKPFVTPSGTRGMYMKDDCCKYDGKIYRSKVDNNVYSPQDYPQNWEEVTVEEPGAPAEMEA